MSGAAPGDRISIAGVRARGFHGVFEEERREGQDFVVDVVLEVDLDRAGITDGLGDTVSYAEVAADIVARVEGEPRDLIERLAEDIAADALARPLVESVEVTVHKPQAPVGVPFGDVAVTLSRRRPLVPVVIALGVNLGDRSGTLAAAVRRLHRAGLRDVTVSEAYETEPVGGPDQPAYLNAVVVGRTRHTPSRLLARLHAVEDDFGRTRQVRWGPRTLDLDLIQYGTPATAGEVTSADRVLTLPHPRAAERAFVLVPWLSADPSARLRVGDHVADVSSLVAGLDTSGVRAAGPIEVRHGGWH
jgi:dihydroneopterin aldolase/2-amino-4-hydroxy-6-hydroxymethyldihydropteridine diphosphokinase